MIIEAHDAAKNGMQLLERQKKSRVENHPAKPEETACVTSLRRTDGWPESANP